MKNLLSLFLLLATFTATAQTHENDEPKQIVVDFFVAFHKQDSTTLKSLAHPTVIMHSIGNNSAGNAQVSTNSYADFISRIASFPASTSFEEIIHSYEVKVNGPLATVLTPYTFMMNGNVSHCGVNSFTMAKESDTWKIVHIIDTRSKESCDTLRQSKN